MHRAIRAQRTATSRSQQRATAVGPVADLAAHVRPDWWRHVFNALYLKTDGDVVDDAATQREVDALLGFLPLGRRDRILDLCCGQGRHSLELARRGFASVEGLDQSKYLLKVAREAARREQLPVTFHEGDARDLGGLENGFDAVLILGNSFGYFVSQEDDLGVMLAVRSAIRAGGTVFLDICDGAILKERFEPRSWEWIEDGLFVCRERQLTDGRIVSREVITDTSKGVICDQFYAERLYTKDQLADLLARAGFDDFTVHAQVVAESERNQDLGMMAHRLFVSAVAGQGRRSRPAPRPRELVVVLGDPGKPDAVKPGGRFGAEDLDTIERMRQALAERPDRAVRYLSNHDDLLDQLRRLRESPAMVVNLCDEGYRNDARHELLVPALLELLGLPYTGAGPQCLARCFDKDLVRGLARELGIAVAPAVLLAKGDPLPAVTRPVIVKPNQGDGAFGIDERSIARTGESLPAAVEAVRSVVGESAALLIEELLTGKELGVGLIGNGPDLRVLPIVEEDYSSLPPGLAHICGYRAKWDPTSPYWKLQSVRADISDDLRRTLTAQSVKLFHRLECRDYARFDWRLDDRCRPCLLEVNPNPGWCWDGHLAKMAALDGLSYAGLLEAVIDAAEERLRRGR